MLTVGLDLRPTEAGFKAHAGRGTGRYTYEVASRLLRSAEKDPELVVLGIGSQDLKASVLERSLLKRLPCGRRTLESQFFFSRRVAKVGSDLVHFFSHGDAPAFPRVPQIVTVLDLIPLRFPDLYRADKPNWRFKFARWLEYEAVRNSQGILAISEATKRDCVELLKVRPEDVVVTPLAVSEKLLQVSGERDVSVREQRRLLKLPEDRKLLLYVGGIDPRKNVPFLLDVLHGLKSDAPSAENLPALVLAGAYEKDDKYPALKERITELGLEDDVLMLGFVPDEHLADLYQSADLFLFPSLYEGFGLPVLEAMACGTAVIAGNNSSLPEVAGDCAVLLKDNECAAWVRTVRELLHNDADRFDRREAGIRHASSFSWDRTAAQTIEGYRYFARRRVERVQGGASPSKKQALP